MQFPNIPKVNPIQDNRFVTVPSDAWNEMCRVVNSIVACVNAQTTAIEAIAKEVSDHTKHIQTLAKVTEEIYETLE